MEEYIAVDTETTGTDFRRGARPFYVSTFDTRGATRCWRFPVDPITREVQVSSREKDSICGCLDSRSLVFHNTKFDLKALSSIGIDIHFEDFNWSTNKTYNLKCNRFDDTLIASHLVNSQDRHGLKDLAVKYLSYSDKDEEKLHRHVIRAVNKARKLGWSLGVDARGKRQVCWDYWIPGQIDPEDKTLETYGTADVERTLLLWMLYKDHFYDSHETQLYEKELAILPVVYDMEKVGMTIKEDRASNKVRVLAKKIKRNTIKANRNVLSITEKIFNLNSSKSLIPFMYDKVGLGLETVRFTDTGNPSTNKDTLAELLNTADPDTYQYKFLRNLLTIRTHESGLRYLKSYQKLCHSERDRYAKIYPSLNPTGTRTTRFSSSNPNGHNIGKINEVDIAGEVIEGPRLRDIFGPAPGKIWFTIDYSQLELRIFAGAANEGELIDALESGYDFHAFVASKIFGKPKELISSQERRIAKAVNFALIFGAKEHKVDTIAGMKGAYSLFVNQFKSVNRYMTEVSKEAKTKGYVTTLFGYPLKVTYSKLYTGVNYVVQGTAGGLIKRAMINISNLPWFDWEDIKIVMQIHDELIFEVSETSKYNSTRYLHKLKNEMEKVGDLISIKTPVTCSIVNNNWGNPKELEI